MSNERALTLIGMVEVDGEPRLLSVAVLLDAECRPVIPPTFMVDGEPVGQSHVAGFDRILTQAELQHLVAIAHDEPPPPVH